MTNRKQLLNNLLDIGGVATLNNLYSPEAHSYKGSLLFTRKLLKFYLENELIKQIPFIGKPRNPSQEVFYCITKKGAEYIGRLNDYKYKWISKSPNQIMMFHESMKFDICLAFLLLYPDFIIEFDYYKSYGGIRPDATITMTSKDGSKSYTFLLEIERKKTIDRTYNEKLVKYEEMFKKKPEVLKILPKHFKILVVYCNLTYNVYLRPQQYIGNILDEIKAIQTATHKLAHSMLYGYNLPEYRYRFMPFPDFYRLNEPVWFTPKGDKTQLII